MIKASISSRLIAFYLPQFHPIPENDKWWGRGFTDWRGVVQARPLFPGHYQPHIPADLGFYDLRLPAIRQAQADLARAYGIHGFCYYHYWFGGRRLLERPFNDVLASGKPDFPFCLCWANENWTRAWDGRGHQILMAQNYGSDDDLAHIQSLIFAFKDPRYIRIDGKALFLIYRPEDLPDPRRTCEIWREEAMRANVGELYLAKVESFTAGTDPREIGFDGTIEFAPDWRKMGKLHPLAVGQNLVSKLGLLPKVYDTLAISDYEFLIRQMLGKRWPEYDFFRCVTPGFDNSPRRAKNAAVLVNSSPDKYEYWLRQAVEDTKSRYEGDRRIVFVNAWNEWGEGNHLEPDLKYGHAFLEATARVLTSAPINREDGFDNRSNPSIPRWKKIYWQARKVLRGVGGLLHHMNFKSSP